MENPVRAPLGQIKAVLFHLGNNLWCDWDFDGTPGKAAPKQTLRVKDEFLTQACTHAAKKGMNMVVLNLGVGVIYPSHPELAINGSWSPEKLQKEINRLNDLGLEVIPKLNFSASHNGWLRHYRRMLSTPEYYKVCEEVIRDAVEIFAHPRFFHIGFDEETVSHQDRPGRTMMVAVRKGEFWWHDFLHIVETCERHGARAWAWSDYAWRHDDYYTRCPKSVVQGNWFYDECYGGFELAANKTSDKAILKSFYEFDRHGFDQIPCGTNWAGWKRRQLKVGGDDIIGKLVKLGRRDFPKSLLGFMMASWTPCSTRENYDFNVRGIDLFAEAAKA